MTFDPLTLYKLIILYMLGRVDFPLSNTTISTFINDHGYTDYMSVQKILGILQDDMLIEVRSNSMETGYIISQKGSEILDFFGNKISDEIKKEINDYLLENKYELKQTANVVSEYYKSTCGDYNVHCYIKDRESMLIDLTVSVPDEELAKIMCHKWKDTSYDVYKAVFSALM